MTSTSEGQQVVGEVFFDRADVYEAVYRGRGKDYTAEAELVDALVRQRRPDAASLLDVACGPGQHMEVFAKSYDEVAGVDLSEHMVGLARKRLPGVQVEVGDMRDFDLGRRFDAVICMFCSVGYLNSVDELAATLRNFARHLNPGGVILVDPWWTPETFTPGHVGADVVEVDGRTIARFSHSVLEDSVTHMTEQYLVASPEHGIEHFTATHRLRLFHQADYENAFRGAGCAVEYLRSDVAPRGMYAGVLAGPSAD